MKIATKANSPWRFDYDYHVRKSIKILTVLEHLPVDNINYCILSFGWFPGLWILCAYVSEHCVSSIFVGSVSRMNNWDEIVGVFEIKDIKINFVQLFQNLLIILSELYSRLLLDLSNSCKNDLSYTI